MIALDLDFLSGFAFFLVLLAIVLAAARLLLGPSVPDRVVAADVLGVITTAGLVWLASLLENAIYLDIALVYGALAFVGVVAVARALESSKSDRGQGE
ncbi:MAG TPA: cation:proton antiporter [Rhizobiales bacterium]|nr:cation:proton antiporter [Hyphomicrobiales bacterium]